MIFNVVTARTGWTPEEISRLTLGQLSSYLSYWVGTNGKKKDDDGFTDLEMFNLMAGIPKKIVTKP